MSTYLYVNSKHISTETAEGRAQVLELARKHFDALNTLRRQIESEFQIARELWYALRDAYSLPDVAGDVFPDFDESHWWGKETATYGAFAHHYPESGATGAWTGVVEWLLNGGKGASDPTYKHGFLTSDDALAWANAEAKAQSEASKPAHGEERIE